MNTPTRYYGNIDAAMEYERNMLLWGFDGTVEGAKAAIEDMKERYYKPMQIAQEQYERDTMETERLQNVVESFKLSKYGIK
jgi:hypothetical protein